VLQRIAVPTLYRGRSAETALDTASRGRAMHKEIPEVALRVLMPFAGHLPNLEEPAQFNAILSEFLDTL
jgi:pimeloyl-ACP methyl ester carboxylesterase